MQVAVEYIAEVIEGFVVIVNVDDILKRRLQKKNA